MIQFLTIETEKHISEKEVYATFDDGERELIGELHYDHLRCTIEAHPEYGPSEVFQDTEKAKQYLIDQCMKNAAGWSDE